MLPNSRESLKQYCLRALGEPVTQVNVDDKQLEDRLDEALEYFQEYHFDGTEKLYLTHKITSQDKTNKYITLTDSIVNIVQLMHAGISSFNMFDVKYQFSLQYAGNLRNMDMITYDMMQRHISLIEEEFKPNPPIRFNRIQNKLYIDTDWNGVDVDSYFVVECYRILDPADYSKIYTNRWLRLYTIELFRKQWGENLSKYDGIELPGGIKLDGKAMRDTAEKELTKLEEQVRQEFTLPADFMIG